MKILLVSDTDVSNNNIESALYVNVLKKYFTVEMWDCSSMYKNSRNMSDFKINIYEDYICINSKEEFENNLRKLIELKEKVIIIHCMILESYIQIVDICNKYHVTSICVDSETYSRWLRHHYFYLFRNELKLLHRIKAIIQNNECLKNIYYFIHYRGNRFDYSFSNMNCFPQTNRHFIKSHYQNYDIVLSLKNKTRIIEGKYALFVDTAFATHPGWRKYKDKPDKALYFNTIRSYLDYFENQTGMDVIIAAYPKVKLENNDFGHRKIIYGKTPELIKYAEVVLMHSSSTIMISIALKKPIIFLYDERWKFGNARSFYFESKYYSKVLGAEFVEMHDRYIPSYKVDNEKYDSFIASTIVYSGHEGETNGDLLIKYLKEIEKQA